MCCALLALSEASPSNHLVWWIYLQSESGVRVAGPPWRKLMQHICLAGAVGYMGTSAFVRKIYTNVKIDWLMGESETQEINGFAYDGGHKSFFTFLSCKEIVRISHVVFSIFLNEFRHSDLKWTRANQTRDIKTRFCFYQLHSNKRWGKCLWLTWLLFSNPVPPETREHKCLLMV